LEMQEEEKKIMSGMSEREDLIWKLQRGDDDETEGTRWCWNQHWKNFYNATFQTNKLPMSDEQEF
jgi:hypothetical protein